MRRRPPRPGGLSCSPRSVAHGNKEQINGCGATEKMPVPQPFPYSGQQHAIENTAIRRKDHRLLSDFIKTEQTFDNLLYFPERFCYNRTRSILRMTELLPGDVMKNILKKQMLNSEKSEMISFS